MVELRKEEVRLRGGGLATVLEWCSDGVGSMSLGGMRPEK